MPGLTIEHLTKSFDGTVILDDINLHVTAGELLVVLGPSGCGKSTLLRLVSGLETPDRGRIVLDDRDISGLEPQKRKTAMVVTTADGPPRINPACARLFPPSSQPGLVT